MDKVGSSPRAWGIRSPTRRRKRGWRFIPTCVGYTRPSLGAARVGGGSSPRAWGIRPHKKRSETAPRFIPTCVGYTSCPPARLCHRAVHPHVRGVYQLTSKNWVNATGSSPRAWGIHVDHQIRVTRHLVHPHVRGVYLGKALDDMAAAGSSPRAWGILPHTSGLLLAHTVHPHVRGVYR